MMKKTSLLCLTALLLLSCSQSNKPDAYGILDARGWQIASPQAGQIVQLEVEEGMQTLPGNKKRANSNRREMMPLVGSQIGGKRAE